MLQITVRNSETDTIIRRVDTMDSLRNAWNTTATWLHKYCAVDYTHCKWWENSAVVYNGNTIVMTINIEAIN